MLKFDILKNNLLLVEDGLKLFFRSKRKQFFKAKKYEGTSLEICEQIINDCYKNYFRVSPNNFNQFYARDFGMVCEALIKLGYKKQVIKTITYAMDIYVKKGKITTQINTRGKALDFPCWSPESVSFMLNSILLTKNKTLIKKYKSFFEEQALFIYNNAIDKNGLLRKDKNFSSMKDFAKQQSSCYVNCFLGLFAENLKKIGVKCDLHKFNYKDLIIKHFWKNNYFVDDLSGKNIISGDANVFPFWTGLVNSKDLFKKSLFVLKQKKLDQPFALKYNNKDENVSWHKLNILNKNYENGTIWGHLAMCYFKVLYLFNEKKELLNQLNIYESLIEKQKSFYEVYFDNGVPFKSLVFEHDEAMIWCAEYLYLKKMLIKNVK